MPPSGVPQLWLDLKDLYLRDEGDVDHVRENHKLIEPGSYKGCHQRLPFYCNITASGVHISWTIYFGTCRSLVRFVST